MDTWPADARAFYRPSHHQGKSPGNEVAQPEIRHRPHVSGYFWIRILFFPDTPFVHTHPLNPTCKFGNFESALHSGNFWIRYFFGYVWTVDGYCRIRRRCKIGSSLYSRLDRVATKQPGGHRKRSCRSCWADFKPRNMCSVKRSYVDCAFKLCQTTFRETVKDQS